MGNSGFVESITIKHLLTQTTGYANAGLLVTASLKGQDMSRLLDIVFNEPIISKPGTHFTYSNASAFILSAFIQELTGETLYSFAQRALFAPLRIERHSWGRFGKYTAGATALSLLSQDLHKLGKLVLQRGIWGEKQVVSTAFMEKMVEPHVRLGGEMTIEHALSPTGYGFLIWLNRGGYYISGAGGQYIIIRPDKGRVISILGNERNVTPLLECIESVL